MDMITAGNWKGFLGMGLAIRELQCVLGIAAGKTSKELAQDSGIAPSTVDKRVLAATTKLGVTRRTALVSEAMRRGIIAPLAISCLAILIGLQHQQPTTVRRPSAPRRVEMRVLNRQEAFAWAA